MLKNYKPLLLNDLFQLYLQQKYNINSNHVIHSFNVNYFLDEEEAISVDIDFFENIFEEVHLTKQENGEFFLELFDLKNSLVTDFDNCYEKNLMDVSYVRIIGYLEKQEILLNKDLPTGYIHTIELQNVIVESRQPDWYLDHLLKKYLHLRNRQEIPFLILPTPYLKRSSIIEKEIASYFGVYFQVVKAQIAEVNGIEYIEAVQLSELKEKYSSEPVDEFLGLIQ